MDKKGDPSYVRFRQSNRERIHELAKKLGGGREVSESDLIDWLVKLALDTYEFHQSHFSVFPIGLNFRINGEESEEKEQ